VMAAAPVAVASAAVPAPAPAPAPSATDDSELVLDGPACTMRPGDAGFEECEACQ
jgi:ribonucleoside-diphosphate reductase alpha chain